MKGRYTTSGNSITMTPTHVWGKDWIFNDNLQPRWYSKADLIALGIIDEDGITTGSDSPPIQISFDPEIATYSIRDNTLTLVYSGYEDYPATYTKR